MIALLVGSALAALGLAFVLMPLLRPAVTSAPQAAPAPELPPEASALEALREIEFDQATGKLSPEDYAMARVAGDAAARGVAGTAGDAVEASAAGAVAEDPVEAMIARAKSRTASCAQHGARPEPDAVFCSDCGRFLGAACVSCGATVESDTARFCVSCGAALAA